MTHSCSWFIRLAAIALLTVSAAAQDADVPATGRGALHVTTAGEELLLDFGNGVEGVPLEAFLLFLEARLGMDVKYAPAEVRQTVIRIVGPQRIHADQLFQYAQSLLKSYRFIAVPFGETGSRQFLKVRKLAAKEPGPIVTGCSIQAVPRDELLGTAKWAFVQSWITLEHTDPEVLAAVMDDDPTLRFGVEADRSGRPRVGIYGFGERLSLAADAIEVVDQLNGTQADAWAAAWRSPGTTTGTLATVPTPWSSRPTRERHDRILRSLAEVAGLERPLSPTGRSRRWLERVHMTALIADPGRVDPRFLRPKSSPSDDPVVFVHASGDGRRAVEITLTADQAQFLVRIVELVDLVLLEGPVFAEDEPGFIDP